MKPRLALIVIAVAAAAHASAAAAAPPERVEMRDGALYLDGRPGLLTSADFHYYRDDPSEWPRKLDLLKEAGVRIVTFYVPWRHHQPRAGMEPDFTGRTQPNRNVLRFIELIRERDMLAIAKPGPFVHAELNYGGLPDFVNPTLNPAIKPDADALGLPPLWFITTEVLPDYFDPEFRRLTDGWLRAVAEQVIRPSEAPRGPVIGVQVLNERIFSDSAQIGSAGLFVAGGASSSGYGAPRVADWGRGDPPRAWLTPSSLAGAERYVSWGLHAGEDYRDAAELAVRALEPMSVPVLVNPSTRFNEGTPELPDDQGSANGDDWLLRTEIDQLGAITRGNTDWAGIVHREPLAYRLYVNQATRARGPNLEENWGFGAIYDPVYAKAQPSAFQSLAYVAWGTTGLNFYTGTSSTWFATHDPELDCYRNVGRCPRPISGGAVLAGKPLEDAHSPYPSDAPIRADGTPGHTYPAMRQLARLWDVAGASLMRADPPRTMAWGLYPPYAAAGAWQPLDEPWRSLGLVGAPRAVFKGSEGFLASAIATDVQAGQEHLPTATAERLGRWRTLVLAGSRWMDAATQRKLVDYVRGGGTLLITGDVPVLGADMKTPERTLVDELLPGARLTVQGLEAPVEVEAFGGRWRAPGAVSVLAETGGADVEARLPDGAPVAVSRKAGKGTFVFAGWQPWETAEHDAAQFAGSRGLAEAVAARFAGGVEEPGDPSPLVEVNRYRDGRRDHLFVLNRSPEARTVDAGPATVRLAGHGAAELMLDGEQIAAAYVDGANDLEPARSTAPSVSVGGCSVEADGPADLLVLPRETSLAYAEDGTQTFDRRDRAAPRSRIAGARADSGGIAIRGRSSDPGCASHERVLVSVARLEGRACRFLTRRGGLGRRRSCRRPVFLRARGTRRFSFHREVPHGDYLVSVRGSDAAGNLEPRRRANTRRMRVG